MEAFNFPKTEGNARIEVREPFIADEFLIFSEILARITVLENSLSSYEIVTDEGLDGISNDIATLEARVLQNEADILLLDARITAIETQLSTTGVVRITDDYIAQQYDEYIFANTDDKEFTFTLLAGTNGKHYKISNTGSNRLIIIPNGEEKIWGKDEVYLKSGDILNIDFESDEGWW